MLPKKVVADERQLARAAGNILAVGLSDRKIPVDRLRVYARACPSACVAAIIGIKGQSIAGTDEATVFKTDSNVAGIPSLCVVGSIDGR